MTSHPRLFVVVGSPGSGKDILVRAVNQMGARHAQIVPKHTNRSRMQEDGPEMICPGDYGFALDECDLVYENFGNRYGVDCRRIWGSLQDGIPQVLVVSNVTAINELRERFGSLLTLVYVHSETRPDEYQETQSSLGSDNGYVQRRAIEYGLAWQAYLDNFLAFDHVLIYAGADEDLYDQIFRLFRRYERQ